MAKTFPFIRKGSNESNEVGDILKFQKEEVIKLREALKVEQVLNRNECTNLVDSEMSLSDWLKKQKTPLRYFVSINIMHEIARDMHYLHDMHVAYLDLNPTNVLVSSMSSLTGVEKGTGYDFVKLADFNASKMVFKCKLGLGGFGFGTLNYMAPEMYNKDKKNVACPFQANVWSFAMTCSEILSLRKPFLGSKSIIMEKVKACMRPELPINCEELTTLIEECWSEDPSQRPTFSKICKRLAALEKKFIVGTYSNDKPRFGKASTSVLSTQLKAFSPKKVDEQSTQVEVVVGIESNLAKVRNHLCETNILGFIGMGGIGKTTLAKATFDDMRCIYDASCFIENLRSKSSLEILCEILQILGMAKETNWEFVDVQKIIKNLLSTKKVLLILDDPKDGAQVDDIIPIGIQFVNNGTKIIITTRNLDIIKDRVEESGKICVGKLDRNASKKLFSSYVSCNEDQLSPDLFDLFDKVVEACDGLPLSLKVMGAFLRGKESIRSWERALERMKSGRHLDGDEGLWSTLRVSFDGLNEDEKNMFLDIACFFCKGILKETAMHIYTHGTSPMHVLDMLVNKSLVNIDELGFLEMHDQLRDLGRMIVETNKEYLGTRIWRKNMIPLETRAHDKGILETHNLKEVEGIYWNEHSFGLPLENCMGFNDLDLNSLRLLIYTNFKTIPKALENWASLTTLTLSKSSSLTILPEGLENLTSLTILDLRGCENLTTLPKGLGNLTSLTTLYLSWCKSLTTLPEGLGNLTTLTNLDLNECENLTTLPEGLGNLSSLTILVLSGCAHLRTLPEGLGNLSSLTILVLSGCAHLRTLPEGVGNLTSLRTLDFGSCSNLRTLPEGLGNLTSLTTLDLSWCKNLTTLPEGLGNLTTLTNLHLNECENLRILPEGLGNLTSLTTLDLSWCKSLTTLPEELGNLTSLTNLHLNECENLTTLPEGLGDLTSLTTLGLRGCESLTTLPEGLGNLTSLTTLVLSGCANLTTLLEGLEHLTSLTTLDLTRCENLRTLPEGLGNLTSLTTLGLSECSISTEVRERFEDLVSSIPLADGLTSDKVDERRTQFEVVVGVESNLAKVRNYLKQVNILVLTLMGAIICRAILFCTITSSMIELVFFCLLNLFPYWNHRRQHKDLCIDKCGGYLFCERVRLCMYMIYVQVCSLWVWTMVHRCHHLPNPHILIWSIVSLSLLLLLLGLVGLSKIEWKYRLWSMLKFVLQGKAYTLSSYIREVVPDLAPCNPFADIVNSHDVDKFITLRREGLENLWLSTHGEEQVLKEDIHKHIDKCGYLKRRVLYPIKTNQRHVFLIGSGWVEVDVLEEDNFRFKSSARGRTVQYFYATLSSQQFSTLVALLAMWEDSPNLGVLENFVGRSDGIYCHCMDLQSIVETLFECMDFTVVVLQKPMKFHIGAKCTREHCSTYLMATLFQVLATVGSYFQLKDNYNNVAIVLTFLGTLVVVGAFTSPSILLLEKIMVYNVLQCFRLGTQRLLHLYLQLKIWKCFLAFCDEFKPVLHQANAEPELITLFNCTHGSFTGDFDRPDWSEVEADQTPYDPIVNGETNVLTSKSGETLEYRHSSMRIFDLKCRRTVFATSTYVGDVLHTQLKLDGDVVQDYKWSEDCYFLFIYLMIKWSRREFGVIRSCRHLMYRRYYHVFNVYELARHIEIHKLTKYKKLLDDSIEALTSMTIPPKLDPANKGEMVAGYHA